MIQNEKQGQSLKKTVEPIKYNSGIFTAALFVFILPALFLLFPGCSGGQAKQETAFKAGPSRAVQHLLSDQSEALCYSGFRAGQHPDRGMGAVNPSYEEVLEDLKIISEEAGFHLIRLYDCGEHSQMTLRIIREENLDIKVMLGIWLRAEISNHRHCQWLTEPIPESVMADNTRLNKQEVRKGIKLANTYDDIIIAVNVGNEALVEWNDHMVPEEKVIAYVRKVRENVSQPVTVADNYDWWAKSGLNLADELDFIAIHVYPVWEGKDIDEAMDYTIQNILAVTAAHPEKNVVITEAGWPTIASEFGDRASGKKQQQYLEHLLEWTREHQFTTFIFEAFDEPWKGNPERTDDAEKHWGLYFENRSPKLFMARRIQFKKHSEE